MSGIHKGESVVNCLKTYSTPRLRLGANCSKKRRTRAGSAQSNRGPKPANALWTNVGENGYPAPGGQSHRSGSTDSREHRGAARALALTASPRRPPNLRRVMETPSPATALGAALSMPRSEAWFREPHYRRREGGARVAEAELVKIRAEAASSRGLLLDVEVCGVELSGLLQAVPIFDDDAAALRR